MVSFIYFKIDGKLVIKYNENIRIILINVKSRDFDEFFMYWLVLTIIYLGTSFFRLFVFIFFILK